MPKCVLLLLFLRGVFMTPQSLYNALEQCPIIAAVRDETFAKALISPPEVIFYMDANLLTVEKRIKEAHDNGKYIFVHLDLAEGIGKDKIGVEYLAQKGADGIISTKTSIIKTAKEQGLLAVQRFFAIDCQGVESISSTLANSRPDLMEIMPGVVGKIIKRFANQKIPLITGGLIESKAEITGAIDLGAFAVSTGKEELWYA